MELNLFNPDADMALADNSAHYIAPTSIRRMANDLALLPLWYSQPGSFVLVGEVVDEAFLRQMQRLFQLDVGVVPWSSLPILSLVRIHPWGWNLALRQALLKSGLKSDVLPRQQRNWHIGGL